MVAHYVCVKTQTVEFHSEGARLRGFLHRPDAEAGRLPFIVQGPGWLGLADAKLYRPYHQAFTDAGFAVLIFDYRGFGESEGDRGTISPDWQLRDWRNAIAYMRERADMASTDFPSLTRHALTCSATVDGLVESWLVLALRVLTGC